jgi:hypothetical protein
MVYPMRSLARCIPPDIAAPALLAIPPTVGYGAGGLGWCLGIGAAMIPPLAGWSAWHSRRNIRRTLADRIVITTWDGTRTELDPPADPIRERAL